MSLTSDMIVASNTCASAYEESLYVRSDAAITLARPGVSSARLCMRRTREPRGRWKS